MTAKPTAFSNAGAASRYPFAREDYYFRGREQSFWFGQGAARLGLAGAVDRETFSNLCHGKIPIYEVKRNERPFANHIPDARPAWQRPGHGMRPLSECRLASIAGNEVRPGVLQIDALTGGPGADGVRRPEQREQRGVIDHFESIHRGGQSKRPGVDFTFSAPKSLSVVVAKFGHDSALGRGLIDAHTAAVREALKVAEERAQARITEDKTTRGTVTGNLIVGAHNHGTSRPVTLAQVESLGADFADLAGWMKESGRSTVTDTQIHTHAFIMNATWCEETQKWRAIDNKWLFDNQKLIEASYHAALHREVREMGLATRQTANNFELACVNDDVIRQQSLRAALVDKSLADRGLSRETAKKGDIDAAVKATRNAKTLGAEGMALRAEMVERIAQVERTTGRAIDPGTAPATEDKATAKTARDGIDSALRHCMERASVVTADDVLRAALDAGAGHYGYREISDELDQMAARGEVLFGRMAEVPAGPGLDAQRRAFAEAEANKEMRAYAADLAKRRGVPAPAGASFTEVREFLDRHSGRKVGLKGEDVPAFVPGKPAGVGSLVLTTRAAQERERAMLASVSAGRKTVRPVMTKVEATRSLDRTNEAMKASAAEKARAAGKDPEKAAAAAGMNAGQREAAELILTSRDRVNVITGAAGAGKSFMLSQAKPLLEAAGLTLHGVAPSHQAKNELIAVTGQGDTLQKFLSDKTTWSKFGPGHVLIVDEAGMASTKQMAELERISALQGFRYVLVGDENQIAAVEAGKPLVQIKGLAAESAAAAHMPEAVRHKTEALSTAARMASRGQLAASLELLDVKTIGDAAARRQHIAQRFVSIGQAAETQARAEGRSPAEIQAAGERARYETLLLTTTNAARKEINGYVRNALGLAGAGHVVNTLETKDTTAESRRFVKTYAVGDILQFTAPYKRIGADRGDRFTVAEVRPDRLILADQRGCQHAFVPANFSSENWTVHTPDRLELAAGDRVRLRENTEQFKNGDWGTVIAADAEQVTIRSDRDPATLWTLDTRRALAIEHGYCMTAHGSQGATRDRTLVDMDTASRTLTRETAYVMNTRSRYALEIVTDDAAKLASVIEREANKPNALDFDRLTAPDRENAAEIEV